MANWRKFHRLKLPEKALFLLAIIALPITAVAIRLFGLRRTQTLLAYLSPSPAPTTNGGQQAGSDIQVATDNGQLTTHQQARALARLVRAAATHGLYRANCLKQSLVHWWFLRLARIESRVRLRARKTPAGIAAHACVEHNGRPISESALPHTDFVPFPSHGWLRDLENRSGHPTLLEAALSPAATGGRP
jgi:hypothetical protein